MTSFEGTTIQADVTVVDLNADFDGGGYAATGTPLARPDSWSWAPVPDLFYPNSPGWNALLGLSWLGGGYWGLFLFTFAGLLTYFAVAYALARRLGAHPLAALAGVTTGVIEAIFDFFGWKGSSGWVWIAGRLASALVAFVINSA